MFNIFKKEEPKKRVNALEKDLPIKPLTVAEIEADEKRNLALINKEFKSGFEFIKKYDKSVTIFGSARFSADDKHSKEAYALAQKIVKELGYAVMTGGGPGIMEAANKGAKEAGGDSLGLTIKLQKEQVSNSYITDMVGFYYFFTRKTFMTFGAEACIFLPGGFGTMDEFFDILTLVQTNKIPKVPIILVGKDFWEPLDVFIKKSMLESHKSIDSEDVNLYHIADDHDKVIEIIRNYPVSNWWRNFEIQ